MFHNSFYHFPHSTHTALICYNHIKTIIEPWIFSLFAGKPFPQSSVNYNDMNLEKKLKTECCDQFSIFVFRRTIDQSIML